MSEPKVVMWYPTSIITCACQEGKITLIIVTGINNPSACGLCGRIFRITGFKPPLLDALGLPAAPPDIEIQIIVPDKKGLVM